MIQAAQKVAGSVGVVYVASARYIRSRREPSEIYPCSDRTRAFAGLARDPDEEMAGGGTSLVVRRQVYETKGLYDESLTCADWEFQIRSALRYDWWYLPEKFRVCTWMERLARLAG